MLKYVDLYIIICYNDIEDKERGDLNDNTWNNNSHNYGINYNLYDKDYYWRIKKFLKNLIKTIDLYINIWYIIYR